MDRVAIVVIAYNRAGSLLRLLDSLTNAYYPEGLDIPLIISVDKSDTQEVEAVARDYVWEHGDKQLKLHEENLGLKKHVLECGDTVYEYDGVILLEDDLYVSPSFYMYTLAALSRTRMEGKIGGISLYNHRMNVHAREPFLAIDDGYDNYYMQFASSWGQAFMRDQWDGFRKWYALHEDDDIAADNVPLNVSSWSERSWLKYYIRYLIDTDRYFLYPRISFTTNFGDEGEHMDGGDAGCCDLQVPLAGIRKYGQIDFHFSDLDESGAVYDAYFENMRLGHRLPAGVEGNVSVDMYGTRQSSGYLRYVLSSKPLPYRMLESYGRRLRPLDANVLYKVGGMDFFLYDTEKPGKAPEVREAERYLYNYRAINAGEMMKILMYRLKAKTPFGKSRKSSKTSSYGEKRVRTVAENAVVPGETEEGMQAEVMQPETVYTEQMQQDMVYAEGMQPDMVYTEGMQPDMTYAEQVFTEGVQPEQEYAGTLQEDNIQESKE